MPLRKWRKRRCSRISRGCVSIMVERFRDVARKTDRLLYSLKWRVNSERAWVRWLIDVLLLPTDIAKIMRGHRKGHGVYPRIIRPQTFNEYLHHSKIFRRSPLQTRLTDKVAVRDYVRDRIGEKYLTRLYWTGTDLAAVDRTTLPKAFVIKANNGSGTNIIVRDKDAVDWDEAIKTTQRWMKTDHSVKFGEWQYRWIRPMLLIEEFLGDEAGLIPDDIKIYCFNGVPAFCLIVKDRFSGMIWNFVSMEFAPIDFTWGKVSTGQTPALPQAWEEMIALSKCLAEGLEFARIDLYATPRVTFGEITFTPDAGNTPFNPVAYDRLIFQNLLSPARPVPETTDWLLAARHDRGA